MSKRYLARKQRGLAWHSKPRRPASGPRLVTPEGDALVFATAHYQHNAMADIRQTLQPLDEFDLEGAEPKPDGTLRFTWFEIEPDPRSHAPVGGERILATLTLTARTLEVEAMSQRRLDNCCQRLEELLGDRLRLVSAEAKGARQALREYGRKPRAQPNEPVAVPPEVMAELEEEMLRQWIDDSIPALGGQSPREAVKTPEGRQQVLDLLDYIERQQSRMGQAPGMFSPDYRKVKKMLGLE